MKQAVAVMATSQLGTQLNNEEIQKIVAFLEGLTGDQPKVCNRQVSVQRRSRNRKRMASGACEKNTNA
jgi:cytochrome c peroxidase